MTANNFNEDTAVAVVPETPETGIEALERMATLFAKSGFFQDARDVAKAFVKVQAGRELGLPPVASMRGIDVVQGQISLRGHLIAAMIKQSGKYAYSQVEHTGTVCRISFEEKRDGTWRVMGEESYTLEDAKQAELLGKENWKKHPRDMLWNRCMGRGARKWCADTTNPSHATQQRPVTCANAGSGP